MKKFATIVSAGALIAVLAVSLGVVSKASADDDNGKGKDKGMSMGMMVKDDMGLGIGDGSRQSAVIRPNGDFQVTGVTANSVSTSDNTVNVTFYGFTRTVSVAGATFRAGGRTIALSDIQAGDKLTAKGNWNETTHAVTVSQVEDISARVRNTSDLQVQINNLLELVRQLQERLRALQR